MFGIEVYYGGLNTKWDYFLYPYIDDNKKTVHYFAFDSIDQKIMYETVLKISGVGPKTAFHIVQLDLAEMKEAITNLDVKFFQNIPGIWPKSAKKILLELKDSVGKDEFKKLASDDKHTKSIITALKWLWYEVEKVKNVLKTYKWEITQENVWEVIKRVIGEMSK